MNYLLFLVYTNVYKLFLKLSVEISERLIIALSYISKVRVGVRLFVTVAILLVYLAKVLDSGSKSIRRRLVRFVLGNVNLKTYKGTVSSTAKEIVKFYYLVVGVELASS